MRSILSIIAGLVVGAFGVFLVKMINLSLFPYPTDLDVNNPLQMSAYINDQPYTAFVLIIIAHIVGSFLAAFISGMVSRSKRFNVGLITGAIMLFFIIWKAFSIGQPTVVNIFDIGVPVIAAILGAKLGASRIVA